MSALPRVTLRKRLARAIRGGHPWIYRDALAGTPRLPDGATVLIAGADGRPLARGFWDARSPIAVRVIGGSDEAEPAVMVRERIEAALARRLEFIDRTDTDAFRWIHGEADRLPGIHVDLYGAAATVRYDGSGARAFYAGLPERLRDAAAARGLVLQTVVERRRRGAPAGKDKGGGKNQGAGNDAGEVEAAGETTAVVLGKMPAGELEVREHGLRFGVDLAHGQKGGLFLDQRDNRALVRTLARDQRVLNLFGYTGGFSVYAAAGGARQTVTVDLAAPAIAAARRNFARNELPVDDAHARFVAGDAFAFLTKAAAAGERFDLVISDPPSFASSRRALPAGLRAYQRLHRLCAAVTAPGGVLCAASCSSHVDRATFLGTIRDGAGEAGRRFALREMRGAGADHPVMRQFPEGDYLKFAVGVL